MPVAARVRPDVWPGVSGPDRVPQVMSSLTRTIASQELCEAGSSRAAGSATSQIVAAATASMMLRIASGLGSPGSLSAKAPGSSSCACLAADTYPNHRQDRGGAGASFEGGGSTTVVRVCGFAYSLAPLPERNAAEFADAWRLANPELPGRRIAVSSGRGCGEGSEPPPLVLPFLAIRKRRREQFGSASPVVLGKQRALRSNVLSRPWAAEDEARRLGPRGGHQAGHTPDVLSPSGQPHGNVRVLTSSMGSRPVTMRCRECQPL